MHQGKGQGGQLPHPILADQKAPPGSGGAPHYYLPPGFLTLATSLHLVLGDRYVLGLASMYASLKIGLWRQRIVLYVVVTSWKLTWLWWYLSLESKFVSNCDQTMFSRLFRFVDIWFWFNAGTRRALDLGAKFHTVAIQILRETEGSSKKIICKRAFF